MTPRSRVLGPILRAALDRTEDLASLFDRFFTQITSA